MPSNFENYSFDFDLNEMKEDLRQAEAKPGQRTSNRSDKYVVFPDGECVLTCRILPPAPGKRKPYASTRLHYINRRAYHCLRERDPDGKWRGNCPICNYYNALYRMADEAKTKDESDRIKEIARKFKPIERNYYNCIIREMFDPETKKTLYNVGPRVLALGKSLHARFLRAILGNEKFKQAPLGNVTHPYTGRDFTIVKQITKGETDYPNYDESRFEEPSILGDDEQIETWLSQLWDLDAERNDELKTYEELQEQVDIVQGKKADPSVGFSVDEYDLPKDVQVGDDPEDRPATRKPPVVETVNLPTKKASSGAKKSPAKETDVPFDLDLGSESGIAVDEDWVKDLQRAVNEAV